MDLRERDCVSFGLVWFALLYLFIHSVTCNNGHANYRLQFTTQLIIYGHPHNTINNNTKFKDQLEVDFVTTSGYICVFI